MNVGEELLPPGSMLREMGYTADEINREMVEFARLMARNGPIFYYEHKPNEYIAFKCFEEFKNAIPVEDWPLLEEVWNFIAKHLKGLLLVWYNNGVVGLAYDPNISRKAYNRLVYDALTNNYRVIDETFIYIFITGDNNVQNNPQQ